MTSILITGVSGYVGQAVAPLATAAFASVTGAYFRHHPVLVPDGLRCLCAPIGEIPALILDLRPDVVLHTAAAWRTEEEAQAVIVAGTRGIAAACAETGARLVHLSTDLVFDGERGPYSESDPPAPVNFYGAAKAEAERIVAEMTPGAAIVRTSLVTCFDPPDPRTQPVLDALRGAREPLTLFTDEYRCPVRTDDLAAALVELAGNDYAGIVHVAGPERLSRHALGLRIAAFYGLDPARGIRPGLSTDSGMVRPRDCSLRIDLARNVLQTPLRPLPNLLSTQH
jgi:dTDP-4-dehydrorhamnose reductase